MNSSCAGWMPRKTTCLQLFLRSSSKKVMGRECVVISRSLHHVALVDNGDGARLAPHLRRVHEQQHVRLHAPDNSQVILGGLTTVDVRPSWDGVLLEHLGKNGTGRVVAAQHRADGKHHLGDHCRRILPMI